MSQHRGPQGVLSAIRIRCACQNNLRSIDCDLPLGKLIVVTGPSGSGKSSLAFDTIYAEGQRRYIETFSPYTRQFFERMNKPLVRQITDIPPAIALEQNNSVRTSRSTVGTLTDINEYLKLLLPRMVQGTCPSCEREIRVETAASIVRQMLTEHPNDTLLVTFSVAVGRGRGPKEFFEFLAQQGYLRIWHGARVIRTDEPTTIAELPPMVPVIQDRVDLSKANKARLTEAVETSLLFGKGRMAFIHPESGVVKPWSRGWHCAHCDVEIRPPTPSLFSFNHPVGACPECKGFGRSLGFDVDKAIPDRALSLRQGCVKMFAGKMYQECQRDLIKAAHHAGINVGTPFMELPEADRAWVVDGDPAARGMDLDEVYNNGLWYGVRGFYNWLESKSYKMHVRIFLSRFRSATPCPSCGGGRYQPETLRYRLPVKGGYLTLPELAAKPIGELLPLFQTIKAKDPSTQTLLGQIQARLGCHVQVGLGYLTLDRTTRTLSGGELQRVN
ncbi:MAG: excinuclease ABC subunit A, partial [Verrucomicrobiia bacterium]